MDSFNSRLDSSLRKRADELRRLTSLLRSELPPQCDGHFHVANIRDRTLVIITDSPVWTTRLRQLGPQILTLLQNSGRKNLLHIRVSSRPVQSPPVKAPQETKTTGRQISPQSCKLINQAASFVDDDGLRTALQNLARHAGAKSGSSDKN